MCSKSEICILIPIYKESLNEYEVQSVNQCIKILSDYTIHFICSNELDITLYRAQFPEIINYNFFDPSYFKDVSGYNCLLMSCDFYKKFSNYEFMLIYQTDCYVFTDELLNWAKKGYDYLGGVWFEGYVGNPYLGSKPWRAGNGGLSLRNIQTMICLLSSKKPLRSFQQLITEKRKLFKIDAFDGIKEFLFLPFNLIGYQNNCRNYSKEFKHNEDIFFMHIHTVYKVLKIPKVEDVLLFSWDRCPGFLFDTLNALPFACHAWYREDDYYDGNKKFWSKHIK